MTTNLTLNLDALINIMHLGTRRASAFMALGLHAAEDQSIDSLTLDSRFQYQFFKDVTKDHISGAQSNFKAWVVGNGLKELDQFTSRFADQAFEILTLVNYNGRSIPQEALTRIEWYKGLTNVAQKFRVISDDYGVVANHAEHMESLSKARNALSHNLGNVGDRHTTHDNELRMSWVGLDMLVRDQVISDTFEPIHVEAGESISVRVATRTKSFQLGAPIELTPHELHEICFTYITMAESFMTRLRQHLQTCGIPSQGTPTSKNEKGRS